MLLDTFLWKKMVFALTKEALFPKWVMTDIVGHLVLVISTQFWKKMGSSLLFLPIAFASTGILLAARSAALSSLLMMLSQEKWP